MGLTLRLKVFEEMGYDIERFVGYVNEGLLCCICRDVLEDPLQAPCEHAFCTSCIHGWLVHHTNCPEDRQPLDLSALQPLYRYMKNDLNRLQLRCRERGCEMVCSLESIDRHERECEYRRIPCSNSGCPDQVVQHNLDSHLAVCEYRSRECPNGCGYAILSADDAQHNCVAELRTELELLRSEMIYRMEEAKHEMESRLDSQRRHMVQKESLLQNEIEELKSQMSRMMSDIHTLVAAERQHWQELEQAQLEKQELLELVKGLQKDCRLSRDGSKKATNIRPLTQLESMKRKPREVTVTSAKGSSPTPASCKELEELELSPSSPHMGIARGQRINEKQLPLTNMYINERKSASAGFCANPSFPWNHTQEPLF